MVRKFSEKAAFSSSRSREGHCMICDWIGLLLDYRVTTTKICSFIKKVSIILKSQKYDFENNFLKSICRFELNSLSYNIFFCH